MCRGFDVGPGDVDAVQRRQRLTRVRRIGRRAEGLLLALGLAVVLSACSDSTPSPEDRAWASEDLLAVSVLDRDRALVASRSGSIYRTEDGAETFWRVYTEPGAALFDLSMLDDDRGWAVGDGRILVTHDAGQSWRRQLVPEGGEAARLRGVHAIDARHAVVVGLGGVRWRTGNGGHTWEDRSDALELAENGAGGVGLRRDADLLGVLCGQGTAPRCVSYGAALGIAVSDDLGASWTPSTREAAIDFGLIELEDGAVELSGETIRRIESLVESMPEAWDVSYRIESLASEDEIEDVSRNGDPEALFEVLEARAVDTVGALEQSGVAAERIRIEHEPPWDYEDLLDDDGEYLSRYWRGRRADRPGVRLVVDDGRGASAGLIDPVVTKAAGSAGVRLLGSGGVMWSSLDGGMHFERLPNAIETPESVVTVSSLEPNGLAALGDRVLAVGARGMVFASPAGDSLRWSRVEIASASGLEADLRDIAISSSAPEAAVAADAATARELGLIVGDAGLILRLDSPPDGWQRLIVEAR